MNGGDLNAIHLPWYLSRESMEIKSIERCRYTKPLGQSFLLRVAAYVTWSYMWTAQ
jgi:hypothetical protein